MVCSCCDPCANKCDGDGAPQELEVTITGVTFRNDSIYDADDLPFSIPTTFLLPLTGEGCRNWDGLFYERTANCTPCNGSPTTHKLGINVAENSNNFDVLIFFTVGDPGAFNFCLGPSNRFLHQKNVAVTFPLTPICYRPISGTITSTNALCALQSVSYTLEPT